jgi:hypothetical protein
LYRVARATCLVRTSPTVVFRTHLQSSIYLIVKPANFPSKHQIVLCVRV